MNKQKQNGSLFVSIYFSKYLILTQGWGNENESIFPQIVFLFQLF